MKELDRAALEDLARLQNPDPAALVDLGWLLIDEDGDAAAAVALAQRALTRAETLAEREDAYALWVAAEDPEDLALVVEAIAETLGAEHHLAAQARGTQAFYAGQPAEALPELERAAQADSTGLPTYLLGCTLERLARWSDADEHLRRAATLDPAYLGPLRVDDGWLDEVIRVALDELPVEIRAELDAAAVVLVEDFPSDAQVADGTDPFLLGECLGETSDHKQGFSAPARVVVYRRNLERACADEDELAEQLRVTLFHEIGHALGLDEDGVAALGLA